MSNYPHPQPTGLRRFVYAAGVAVIVVYFGGIWLIVSALAWATGNGRRERP